MCRMPCIYGSITRRGIQIHDIHDYENEYMLQIDRLSVRRGTQVTRNRGTWGTIMIHNVYVIGHAINGKCTGNYVQLMVW